MRKGLTLDAQSVFCKNADNSEIGTDAAASNDLRSRFDGKFKRASRLLPQVRCRSNSAAANSCDRRKTCDTAIRIDLTAKNRAAGRTGCHAPILSICKTNSFTWLRRVSETFALDLEVFECRINVFHNFEFPASSA